MTNQNDDQNDDQNDNQNDDQADDQNENQNIDLIDEIGSEIESGELEAANLAAEGTELEQFDAADIEEVETLSETEITAAVEALLFATEKPQSVAVLKSAFQGTKVRAADIRAAIERLQIEYSNPNRGVFVEEVVGGYQIRTKVELQKYLHRMLKARPFRLSGPALEVLSIVAYKQPCTKAMVDEIRGVESGHLMRALLDRGMIHFGEKSDLPGRPMFYETSKRFLEVFGLRNIQELPTLQEIDQLIPEGIGEDVQEKPKLSDITGELSTEVTAKSYSENEEELIDISSELKTIDTTTEFFEAEKRRAREKRDADRAQEIRERLTIGEPVDAKDKKWLDRYEAQLTGNGGEASSAGESHVAEIDSGGETAEIDKAVEAAANASKAVDTVTDAALESLGEIGNANAEGPVNGEPEATA